MGSLATDSERFVLELEMVQCLASADYLHYLAEKKYLDEPAFIEFLKYLLYWREPEYSRFLTYPHCLYFLELLQDAGFREACKYRETKDLITSQHVNFWRFHRNNMAMKKETTSDQMR